MATAFAYSCPEPSEPSGPPAGETEREHMRRELEERYRQASDLWPRDRVEIINDRIVVSPVPTWVHELVVFQLMKLLMAVVEHRGWAMSCNISLFLGTQRDRYKPDLTVAPTNAPLWGKDHVHGDATVLVVEVVSSSSVDDDHNIKPTTYAAAGVPLCLVIDTFANTVRLLSQPNPKTERYEQHNEVPIGKTIELPDPWNLSLDTGKLTG
ncbi:MAG TPA: Uma2 family endonuclease [Streptosporangiaceae bacterium]